MSQTVLADTGPLVALCSRRDSAHGWAVARFHEFGNPVVTAEPILVEALYLLRRVSNATEKFLGLWSRGLIVVSFSMEEEKPHIIRLMQRFKDVPISIADACLVRLSEAHSHSVVWTLDNDFRVYRRNGRQAIPLLTLA